MRWILSLLLAAVVAVGVGYGLFFLDTNGFYLIFVMAILVGAVVGFFVSLPMAGKQVATAPLAIIGILAALGTMGVYWYLQYDAYQNGIVEEVQRRRPSLTTEEALAVISDMQQEQFGSSGFQAFLAEYADVGFGVGDVGSSSTDMQIQGNIAYGYWGLELIIAAGIAVLTIARRGENKLFQRIGGQTAQ